MIILLMKQWVRGAILFYKAAYSTAHTNLSYYNLPHIADFFNLFLKYCQKRIKIYNNVKNAHNI